MKCVVNLEAASEDFHLVIRPNNANTLLCMDTNNTPYRHPTQKSGICIYNTSNKHMILIINKL